MQRHTEEGISTMAQVFATKRVMRTGLVILVLVLLSGLFFALSDARGREADDNGSKGDKPAGGQVGSIPHPTGPKDVIVRIEQQGGFRMPTAVMSQRPAFTLYGDGCYIIDGPMLMIYPPMALPNLQQGCLTEEGVQHILRMALDAGLLDEGAITDNLPDADMVTTVVTVNANGKTVETRAYALGSEDMFDLTVEQIAARERMSEFVAFAPGVGHSLPASMIARGEQVYDFERLQVFVLPAEMAADPSEGMQPQVVAWPLPADLANFGAEFDRMPGTSCAVVEGADLATLLPVLQSTNVETRWSSNGAEYVLIVMPLLPEAAGCGA
jgi:hypothetical protein